jgi:hypothetical protein
MKTSHSNQRLLALCALIAEEKDPDKFLLLVHELNDAFENKERGVGNSHLTSARPKGSVISPQA